MKNSKNLRQKLSRGGKIADDYFRQCKVVNGLIIIFLFYLLLANLNFGGAVGYWYWIIYNIGVLFWVLGILGAIYLKNQKLKRVPLLLYEECDPFVYKDALETFRAREKSDTDRDVHTVHVAAALMLQGYVENAYQVVSQLDFKKLPHECCYHYYNITSNYFMMMNQADLLMRLRHVFEELAKGAESDIRKLCRLNILNIDLYFAMKNKDFALFDQLTTEIESQNLNKMQESYLHLNMAYMDAWYGNTDSALEHCRFVTDNGNRLFCTEDARALTKKLKAGEAPEKNWEPVREIIWDEGAMYKPEVDTKFFQRNRKDPVKQRAFYALVTLVAFFIGFIFSCLRYQQIQDLLMYENYQETVRLLYALFDGVTCAGLVTGGWFVYLCMKTRSRIAAGIFCLLLIFSRNTLELIGIVAFIPYYIYNLVRLFLALWNRRRRNDEG